MLHRDRLNLESLSLRKGEASIAIGTPGIRSDLPPSGRYVAQPAAYAHARLTRMPSTEHRSSFEAQLA